LLKAIATHLVETEPRRSIITPSFRPKIIEIITECTGIAGILTIVKQQLTLGLSVPEHPHDLVRNAYAGKRLLRGD